MNPYDLVMMGAQATLSLMAWRVAYEGRRQQPISLITSAIFTAALAVCAGVLVLTGLTLSGVSAAIGTAGWAMVFAEHWRQGRRR